MKHRGFYSILVFLIVVWVHGQETPVAKQEKEKKTTDSVSTTTAPPAAQKAEEKKESVSAPDSAQGEKTVKKTESPKEAAVSAQPDEAPASVKDSTDTSGRGTLTINTVPESALVIFNGVTKGKTPFVLRDIVPGKHTLLLKKKGHFAKKATVNVIAGSENELTFELVKPVTLTVSSDPKGATVFLNRNDVGKTPFTDTKLKPGSYEISLNLAGYILQQHNVELGSGEKDSMHVTLKPMAAPSKDTTAQAEEKVKEEKDKSKVSSILDKIALAVFIGFSLIILLIELTQDK